MGTKFYKAYFLESYNKNLRAAGKYFLTFFVFLASYLSGHSQTNLTFTKIPVTNTNPLAPGRGAQYWNNSPWDDTYDPTVPAGNKAPLNRYYRFNWVDIENTNTQGSYDFTIFDAQMNAAIDAGEMFTFGIMAFCSACGLPNYGYPTYVHNGMQAEAAQFHDWQHPNGFWVPNYGSNTWKTRYLALLRAVANHIASSSHSGHTYTSAFLGYDQRHYSDFGEGNGFPTGTTPATAQITDALLMFYTDSTLAIYPNVQSTVPMSYVAPNNNYNNALGNTGTQAAYHELTVSNNYGRVGWRRDNIGDEGYNVYLTGTTATYNPGSGPVALLPLIMNNWKVAPIGGEPANDLAALTRGGPIMFGLHDEDTLFHMSYFGNGNYPVIASDPTYGATLSAAIRAGSAELGYSLILDGGSTTTSPSAGGPFNITLLWKNVGLAPVYEKWNVTYELRNGATVVWTGTSNFTPKLFLPSGSDSAVSDNLVLTAVTPGTYNLYLVIRDPVGYKSPLPLNITGRQSDGSYLLRSNIAVVTGTGNQPPTANAGTNQTIQLPASAISLSGTGADVDGTISSYSWTEVSGPSGGIITSPITASTIVSGLTQGVYVFKLTVTDNLGATGSATVQVTVNPASVGSAFPVNAGPDQTLPAGTTTTSLTGTFPASTTGGPSADTANLIVIWGESNAAGDASNSSALPSELASRSSVQIYNQNSGIFENLQIGVNNEQNTYIDNTHHGLELGLANEVEAGRLKNPTYLVKIGVSGSYICQWLHEDGTTCRPSGNLWDGWIPFVDGAVAKMKAMGKPFRIIVWQSIGLNDAYSVGTSSSNFVAMMATFRADFRTRFGANIPFLGTDFNNPPAQTYAWTTLFAQMAATDPDYFVIPVTGATYVDAGVHWDYAGMKLIAHNMVNTMLSIGEGPSSGSTSGTTYTSVWSEVSGPAGITIVNSSAANTNITGLTTGNTYTFRLGVTDNLGNTVADSVNVIVNAGNLLPTANAGPDQNITLPTNSVTLSGAASSDPDGTISSYLWTKISGPAQFTIANNTSASTIVGNLTAGVYSFQLKVTDNSGAIAMDTIRITVNAAPANQPPVANAGANITITLPSNIANLNGSASTDPDGTITAFAWSQISGPSTASIAAPGNASTGISGLQQGIYVFALKVTDNGGATNTDSVTVTVNPAADIAPIANAGAGKTIILPTNSINLDGSLSSDPDGNIISYSWTQTSGPSSATILGGTLVVATATNLGAGVYIFQLTVTDNGGLSNSASVKITVSPSGALPPIANAGANQTITLPTNSVTIDGSGSSASSGSIVSFVWTEKSGPSSIGLTNTAQNTLNNLQAGVYIFDLTVTDSNGDTGSDSVIITVNAATNIPPVSNPGASVSLILPANSTSLNGTASYDPDGTIVSYSWTMISGPNSPTTSGANTATLNVSSLVAGKYIYKLTVADNKGASSSALVNIIVTAAANIPPVANAGSNQTITAPASTVLLNGSGSYDPDGTITAYNWVTISGPGSITINNSNTATPSVIGLQTGVYTFQLTVTDNSGATSSVQVFVTVLPPVVLPNQAPVANAGSNLTITLPVNSVSLNGTSSFDPDGSISTYAWSQVSGPSASIISAANTSTPNVSQLIVGQYVFQLTVSDNNGATNSDEVTITVNPATAKVDSPPVADAGPSDTITLPNNTYMLNASQSTDPNGTITSYEWQQIGGPNTVTGSGMNNAQVSIGGLQQGQYEFQVTVTNNAGETSTATMKLTVEPGFSTTEEKLAIFPNPASSQIHEKISSTITGTVKINVYDMNGQLVMASQIEKSSESVIHTMNVSTLAPGMYTIQINIANQKTMVAKFIKN